MNNIVINFKEKFKNIFIKKETLNELYLQKNNGLGNFLVLKGILTNEQLKEALKHQQKNIHKKIGEILTEINILGEEVVLKELAEYMNVNYISLDNLTFPLKLQNIFEKSNMAEHLFAPFDLSGNVISIAISDIKNLGLRKKIKSYVNDSKSNYHVTFYLSLPNMIKRFIYNSYAKHPHTSKTISTRKKFGEYLIENEIITEEQLKEVLRYQEKFIHKRLAELLYEMNIMNKEQALKELAIHENKKYEPLNKIVPNRELIKLFDLNYMKENYFIPFDKEEEVIKIAVNNIFDDDLMENINNELSKHKLKAKYFISLRDSIQNLLMQEELQQINN